MAHIVGIFFWEGEGREGEREGGGKGVKFSWMINILFVCGKISWYTSLYRMHYANLLYMDFG